RMRVSPIRTADACAFAIWTSASLSTLPPVRALAAMMWANLLLYLATRYPSAKLRTAGGNSHMATPSINVCLIGHKFMGRTHSNAYLKVYKFFTDLPVEPAMHTICGRNM